MLADTPGVTAQDFFDKDYLARHDALLAERIIVHTPWDETNYQQAAQALAWIDREENDYFISIPKTINDFRYEGSIQHNCVYTCMYFRKVINRSSIIIFLRKEKEEPFVTIELDYCSFEIKQALGKYNRRIDAELYSSIENLTKELYFETISRE